LPASAELLNSTPAVLPDTATAFARIQFMPRMEHRLR